MANMGVFGAGRAILVGGRGRFGQYVGAHVNLASALLVLLVTDNAVKNRARFAHDYWFARFIVQWRWPLGWSA
jgi:hypothetical protein